MSAVPKLSYIVLSYNYRQHIGKTLESILNQTVQDFEIIVVDDASSDDSPSYIQSFDDRRVKLFVNETNLGGAASYNRAVCLARGEFLVNLDADDWVSPEKAERQLKIFESDPALDVVGTYVNVIDSSGNRHVDAEAVEGFVNRPLNLNAIENWVIQNPLCRSSTMMRRNTHMSIGLDDPSMTYACDFELWTRALNQSCRFAVVPEKLTWYRVHSANITNKNTKAQLVEIVYLINKNILPIIERTASRSLLGDIVTWIAEHDQFAAFKPAQRYRLLASLLMNSNEQTFESFRERVLLIDSVSSQRIGQTVLALSRYSSGRLSELAHFIDVQNYEKAKSEWFIPRIKSLEDETERLIKLFESAQAQVKSLDAARTGWFAPRIGSLEVEVERLVGLYNDSQSTVRALVDAKSGWFVPRVEQLEAEIAQLRAVNARQIKQLEIADKEIEILSRASDATIVAYRGQVATLNEFECEKSSDLTQQLQSVNAELRRLQDVIISSDVISINRQNVELIESSILFDERWYRALIRHIPDQMRAAIHYLLNGGFGAAPGPHFDAAWYLQQNPDVAEEGVNPLVHYLRYGKREGRKIRNLYEDEVRLINDSSLFDEKWYRSLVPNLPSEISAIIHYLLNGRSGISPSRSFDAVWYLQHNPDVAAAGVNPLVHYLRDGRAEGRECSAVFLG